MSLELLHELTSMLRWPVIFALLATALVAVADLGMALGEWVRGRAVLREVGDPLRIDALARRRIGRSDTLARIGPMLGLMGTLIPLGPGLAALGRGDVQSLASAMTVAFDTTVLGLFVAVLGYLVGRQRRRWYSALLDEVEAKGG